VKITVKFQRDKVWDKLYLPIYLVAKKHKWRWQTIGAGVSLASAFISPVIGTILEIFAFSPQWSDKKPILNKISIFFYAVTIPLFFFGAHLLDLLEKKEHELRQNETPVENRPEELRTKSEDNQELNL
jgi:hypothetical protein